MSASIGLTILGMAVGIYMLRIGGFALAGAPIPASWERALTFVPIATLTALVTSSLISYPDETPIRLLAALGAGLAARRFGKTWVCIVSGMVFYWMLRMV
jgi:branched-subunit amino acid transport protein